MSRAYGSASGWCLCSLGLGIIADAGLADGVMADGVMADAVIADGSVPSCLAVGLIPTLT